MANLLKKAYNTTHNLSDAVWNLVMIWDMFSQTIIGNAFVRSLDNSSIALAKAAQAQKKADQETYLRSAKEYVIETLVWLDKARRRKLVVRQDYHRLYVALQKLQEFLVNYQTTAQKVSKLQDPS